MTLDDRRPGSSKPMLALRTRAVSPLPSDLSSRRSLAYDAIWYVGRLRMPDEPVKIRIATRLEADALVEQLARATAQIAEFEARPEGRSAVLAALRKRR